MQYNTSARPDFKETFCHSHVSLALIIDLLRASRELFICAAALRLQSEQDRKRLALLLTRMGEELHELYEKLEAGQTPKGTCYNLEQLSYQLHFQIAPVLGNMRAQALTDKFNQTQCISLLSQQLASGLIDQRELILLQTAANHLTETALKIYPHD